MYPILYLIVPLIWSACCATAEVALNKVGFYSNEVQTMVPSVEPSGASDNEGSALIKYGEALQQLLDQKLQAKAQLKTEIDLKRAAGWSSADLRLLQCRTGRSHGRYGPPSRTSKLIPKPNAAKF